MEDKHSLHNAWTLWYDSKSGKPGEKGNKEQNKEQQAHDNADWEKNLVTISTVTTVEEFWIMQNHVKKPSSIDLSANYHFFKAGVKPMWEDPTNSGGGKWSLTLTTKEDLFRLDAIWEDLLLSIIGEYLDPGNELVGCVLGKRRNNVRIAIWTKNKDDTDGNMKIGQNIRKELRLAPAVAIEYFPHNAGTANATPAATLKA